MLSMYTDTQPVMRTAGERPRIGRVLAFYARPAHANTANTAEAAHRTRTPRPMRGHHARGLRPRMGQVYMRPMCGTTRETAHRILCTDTMRKAAHGTLCTTRPMRGLCAVQVNSHRTLCGHWARGRALGACTRSMRGLCAAARSKHRASGHGWDTYTCVLSAAFAVSVYADKSRHAGHRARGAAHRARARVLCVACACRHSGRRVVSVPRARRRARAWDTYTRAICNMRARA